MAESSYYQPPGYYPSQPSVYPPPGAYQQPYQPGVYQQPYQPGVYQPPVPSAPAQEVADQPQSVGNLRRNLLLTAIVAAVALTLFVTLIGPEAALTVAVLSVICISAFVFRFSYSINIPTGEREPSFWRRFINPRRETVRIRTSIHAVSALVTGSGRREERERPGTRSGCPF